MKTVKEVVQEKIEWFMDGNGQKHDFTSLVKKIGEFIKANPDYRYQVIVGTDSETKKDQGVDFVTAIVAHRIGQGGTYLWFRESIKKQYSLQERIGEEASRSVQLAWRLRDAFRANGLAGYEPEVHVDIGEKGKTREMIRWIVGMVKGSGFVVKIKPDSFTASKVADRHT
jgi:predicted RNase H-related nuclease YkuK (DUF458 family)